MTKEGRGGGQKSQKIDDVFYERPHMEFGSPYGSGHGKIRESYSPKISDFRSLGVMEFGSPYGSGHGKVRES